MYFVMGTVFVKKKVENVESERNKNG